MICLCLQPREAQRVSFLELALDEGRDFDLENRSFARQLKVRDIRGVVDVPGVVC